MAWTRVRDSSRNQAVGAGSPEAFLKSDFFQRRRLLRFSLKLQESSVVIRPS